MNVSGRTHPMSRKGRFSSWSMRFTPWLTLSTACTRTSVLEKLVSALKWTPLTARYCSSTSATSTSQVGAPDSGWASSTSVIQITLWYRETFQVCVGKEDMYSHLWETNVWTSRNSKAFVWIQSISPIIGLRSELRLCQRSALQLPGLWMHIVPTNYKRQRVVGGLTISSKTACFTAVDDAQQRSAFILSVLNNPREKSPPQNKVAEIKHCAQIRQGTDTRCQAKSFTSYINAKSFNFIFNKLI